MKSLRALPLLCLGLTLLCLLPSGVSSAFAAEAVAFDPKSARTIVTQAEAAMMAGGAPMLEPFLSSLVGVLSSAAASPKNEDAIILGSKAGYALGWYYNDIRQHELALPPLEQAVALNPDNMSAASERIQALNGLQRFDQALVAYDYLLAGTPTVLERALLLRGKGFALTELKRLDEAAAAYEESLQLEPDHQGARNELLYIQRLRTGGTATPTIFKTYDKAKNGN